MENQNEKAQAILKKGNPIFVNKNIYLVPSQSSDRKYKVTSFDNYACDCKDFEHRCKGKGLHCKHIKAVLLFEKKYIFEPEVEQEIELTIETPKRDCCPYCQSEEMIKKGKRKTNTGEKQRYSCKTCKKRFVLSPIKKIKVNEKFVCLAMDCFYKGLSYRDISDQFLQFYSLKLNHETIRRWILKFSKIIAEYVKTLTPKTSGIWSADETMILTKNGSKDKNRGYKDYVYLWNVMDNDTKFLLASINSGRGRSTKDASRALREAWKQNKKMPNQIITDRLAAYANATRKVFKNYGYRRKIKYTSIVGHRKQINNNAIESHHSHQKEFHRVRRGVKEVQGYADGFRVYHNFVRKNVKDNKTPAEKCGIEINNPNKWSGLLLKSLENEK